MNLKTTERRKTLSNFVPNERQAKFLDTANWAFNVNYSRGSGRTTAMAYTAIQLAMANRSVYLFDPSILFEFGTNYAAHRHFQRAVLDLIILHFPNHDFRFDRAQNRLSYRGPRLTTPIHIALLPVEIEDDGSDEKE